MKNILLSFLFLSLSAYGQWVELDTGIEVSYFSDVYALSTDVAVVVGANGTIIKTTDGGETWEQKGSGTTDGLLKIEFPTQETGYVIGENGTLLKTIDGGETWSSLETGVSNNFGGLSVINENEVFISTRNKLIKSTNGGNSFLVINTAIDYDNPEIQFLTSEIGFFWDTSTYDFYLRKTQNGGESWSQLNGESPTYFLNESVGFYYSTGLFKTINSGETFSLIEYGNGNLLRDIYAINENIIWGIDSGGTLDGDPSTKLVIKVTYSETDYTEDIWYDNDTNIDMRAIHFANETTGYIVGYSETGATVWKNSTGINEGLSVKEADTLKNIKVYPNPSSSELNIDLSDTSDNSVVISLIDIAGKQIFSKSFTQKQIKINTQQFVKGTYILQVKTNDKNYTQKVIIN